jgi:predicted alpha/beta superfamily hydrolase
MKKFFALSFIVILFSNNFSQSNNYEITFVVYSTSVNDSESVFIVGSDPQLGNWNPEMVKLFRVNDSTWIKSFKFETGKYLEYKFTKGLWEKEALNEAGFIPENSALKVLSDSTIAIRIKKWNDEQQRISHGQITGKVKYHFQFEGDGLKPRDIVVWLPPSYEDSTDKRYPVFYMHDGQNTFDPATSSFGYDWRADEVTDSLIKTGDINEIIIVAINNTVDRGKEYVHSNLGYAYMDFLVNKLKPFIDKQYRTLPDKENTAVCGASLGGLISLMLVWNYPQVFSKAACLSSAFKIDQLNYVDSVASYNGMKKDIKLYIDNGGIGLDAKLQPGNDEMIVALQNKGYELGKDIIWYVNKNAAHSEIAWAERIWRPLVFFFGKR